MNGDGSHLPERPHDTGERRRRSDPRGVRAKIDQASESTEAKFLARIAGPTVVVALLTFFGMQIWDGQKEIADKVGGLVSTVNLHEWRINWLEHQQQKKAGP